MCVCVCVCVYVHVYECEAYLVVLSLVSVQKPDYEYSEMVLYEAKLWMEYERPDDALHHISEFREHICDELAVKELLGKH